MANPYHHNELKPSIGSPPRWLDLLIITATAGLMLAWTWRTWPDPLVDFGRELYVPWQLTTGQTLYSDIAYFNGPLSPYFNAACMQLLGVSLNTLIIANLLIASAVLTLLYALLNAVADRLAAITGALIFLSLFAFARLETIGNYNFACPYSHDITHGIALSLGAIASLHLPKRLQFRFVALAGLLTGLACLTKIEVAAACLAAISVGFTLRLIAKDAPRPLQLASALITAILTPPLIAFALLYTRLPFTAASKGVLGSFYWTFHTNVSSTPFYRSGLGIDDLPANLQQMAVGFALLSLAVIVAVSIGFLTRLITRGAYSKVIAGATFFLTIGAGIALLRWPQWLTYCPQSLPFVLLVILIVSAIAFYRQRHSPAPSHVAALRVAFPLFALFLLAKMLFNTRLNQYGFALAMPAVLLLAASLVSWIPRFAASLGTEKNVIRAVFLALLAVAVTVHLLIMSNILARQRHWVGSGPDAFLADDRGAAVQTALIALNKLPPDSSLLVLPEGVMINYLSRRPNPTPYVNLMPPELLMFTEDRILEDFQAGHPDLVLLAHKDTTEYGAPLFGRDYGSTLLAWINENYSQVTLIEDRPLQSPDRFGILLLQRR